MGTGSNEYYDEQWLPALNTRMYQNLGKLTTKGRKFKETGTRELSEYNGSRIKHVELKPDDVGLDAPDRFCDDGGGTDPDDDYAALVQAYQNAVATLNDHEAALDKVGAEIAKLTE